MLLCQLNNSNPIQIFFPQSNGYLTQKYHFESKANIMITNASQNDYKMELTAIVESQKSTVDHPFIIWPSQQHYNFDGTNCAIDFIMQALFTIGNTTTFGLLDQRCMGCKCKGASRIKRGIVDAKKRSNLE